MFKRWSGSAFQPISHQMWDASTTKRPTQAGEPAASRPFPLVAEGARASDLNDYFETLSRSLGPMGWWPARTPFEVIVGAILTQNTSWTNVEKAIANLRRERLLTPHALERVPEPHLAKLIRPSGYFRQKAQKLKAFVQFLRAEHSGSLRKMFRTPTPQLRQQLLEIWGIGPETADSILLYAGQHTVFVVDAYTHRILGRHGLLPSTGRAPDYEAVRALFETRLPRNTQLYNEFHALLVKVGKNWCRTRDPRCEECPLKAHLPTGSLPVLSGLPS